MKAFYYRLLGDDNPLSRYPKLLDAALNEFARKNFEDASLNNILKEANMSKGSLYHNFGDKLGLYLAMVDIIVRKKTAEKKRLFAELKRQPGPLDFFDKVKSLVNSTMQFMYSDERFYQVLCRNLEESEEFKKQLTEIFPPSPKHEFEALIQSAIAAGQLDSRFSPDFIAGVFEILLTQCYKLLPPDNPGAKMESVTDQIIDMIRYGVAIRKEENE